MTDIVMNLFIFFFISFSLLYTFNTQKERKIEVKLPQGAARQEAAAGKSQVPFVINITSGNEIYLDQKKVLPDQLSSVLAALSRDFKRNGVLVRSDKAASVDYLVRVLDAARQAGMQKLGVALEYNNN